MEFYDKLFGPGKLKKIQGLKKLSYYDIESKVHQIRIASILTSDFSLIKFCEWIQDCSQLKIREDCKLVKEQGDRVLGFFDSNRKVIIIKSKELIGVERYAFIKARLIGHFILHRNLKVDALIYNEFKVSEDNWLLSGREPQSDIEWVEWEACQFAFLLLSPTEVVFNQVRLYHEEHGGNGRYPKGMINLDYYNNWELKKIIFVLPEYFEMGRDLMEYRLNVVYRLLIDKKLITTYIDFELLRKEAYRAECLEKRG